MVRRCLRRRGACHAVLMHLLLVEDDPGIAEPLMGGLIREGFTVTWAKTGGEALAAKEVDLVLLDLGLPDIDGQVVCRRIREASHVPIIIVTARGDEIDKVSLLEIGADDYVQKPFGFRELVARVRAVLRRSQIDGSKATSDGSVCVGSLSIDQRTRDVILDETPVTLSPKEFDLLLFLASEPGTVRTREAIIREVWDENWWGPTKTLDVHIASLRKKLTPDLIETVRGVGYRMSAPKE